MRLLVGASLVFILGCTNPPHEVIEGPPNVILFLGDGMGVSTITAARILEGQQTGRLGEENYLSFEHFENVALVKTYNTDSQVPDSAGTMTAIMSGVKTRAGVIGVGPELVRGDCLGTVAASLPSLVEQAEDAGMQTGIVSTTRITHATPAATYAHIAERAWEADAYIPENHRMVCKDIALQLAEFSHGDGIDIILGGGRAMFLPNTTPDPEDVDKFGVRTDGRHLINEWVAGRIDRQFVWNKAQFDLAKPVGQLLGLFDFSDMEWEIDREFDAAGEPSLASMTETAIRHVEGSKNGFFLVVEAGRIDHGHHVSNAYRALMDTIALSNAVQVALDITNSKNTLIVVTADHSHTLTISGYPARGNPILGYVADAEGVRQVDEEGSPYTTLSYANGPGFRLSENAPEDPHHPDYTQVATWPLKAETHGGEDVPAYATGPGGENIRGVMDQNEIYQVLLSAMPQISQQPQTPEDTNEQVHTYTRQVLH